MRRIVVVLVLVLIFAVLLFFSRTVASWQHDIRFGASGSLLYVATFDGAGTDGFNGDWSQYPGRLSAQIMSGQMQISVGQVNGSAYSHATPHFGDFDLRADAQLIGGSEQNGYGLIFRLQNKDDSSVDDDSYYVFLVSGDGYYQVSRTVNGKVKVLSDWIASDVIHLHLNAVNHLRVVAQSDQFHFYINDQPVQLCIPNDPTGVSTYSDGICVKGTMVDMLSDDSIAEGQIGVTAQWWADADAQPPGTAAFDNVLVFAPGSK